MRILLALHHELNLNQGAPGATLQLGDALRAEGHDVEHLSWDDMPARWSPRAKELLFPEWMAWAMRRRGPYDVVDAASGDAWLWGAIARRRGDRRPLIATRAHGLEHRFAEAARREASATGESIGRLSRLYHHHTRLWEGTASLRVADLCLFMNEGDRAYAVERLGIPAERTQLVANGLPGEFIGLPFQPLPADRPVRIAQVGSFDPRKGVRYGVPAMDAVLRRHPEASATLVGTGVPPATALAGFSPAARKRVTVVEHFDHARLPTLLAGHAIKLFPSLAEGFSLALIEAMACGLAPVATGETAAGIVHDGVDGVLVPAGDASALELALERLIEDRDALEGMRAAAHARAQRYAWSQIGRDATDMYSDAIRRLA
jgi:glycosyltransferase involved in cell wall biosynthesis